MWHYSENGNPHGPISEAELDGRIRAGTLPATVIVWREGMQDWRPYNELRAPSVEPISALRMVDHAPVGSSSFVAPGEFDSTGVGHLKCKSISSWATVAVVFIAMFAFLGVLSSRPRMADNPFSQVASEDEIAEQTPDSTEGLGSMPGTELLHACLRLRSGELRVENHSSFDWTGATVSFDSDGVIFLSRLGKLPRKSAVSFPVSAFVTPAGIRYGTNGAEPSELRLDVENCGTSVVRMEKRR